MTNLKHGLNHECRSLSNCETNKTVDGNVVLLVEGDYRVLDYLQGDYLQGGLSTGSPPLYLQLCELLKSLKTSL